MELSKALLEEKKKGLMVQHAQAVAAQNQAIGAIATIDHLIETLEKPETKMTTMPPGEIMTPAEWNKLKAERK